MTPQQLTTLKAHILASTDPAVVAARGNGADIGRNDTELARLYNLPASPTTAAWLREASARQIFEATNVNLYDNVAAGKRDAWRMLMDFAPVDFGRNARRNTVVDVWSAQTANQRNAVLNGLTEPATVAQVVLGGTNDTAEGVTALTRNFWGQVTIADIGAAMNG